MISTILADAWRIFRERFGVIVAVVVVVWLPCELFSSYCDAFVFGPDDIRKSLKLAHLLDNFIGIIATAGVTFIALEAHSDRQATFGRAIGVGFRAWGRMWGTRFLTAITLFIAFLLLIIPGIYFLTRLCFIESIVVTEHISGVRAMRRSFAITEGRFWPTFRLGLVLLLLLVLLGTLVILPTAFIPALDHWYIDAVSQLACDVIGAFTTVALLCGYQAYSNESGND